MEVAAEVAAADSDPRQIAHETQTPFKQLPHQGAAWFRNESLFQRGFLLLAVHPGQSKSESNRQESSIQKPGTPAVSAEIGRGFRLDTKTENPVKSFLLSAYSSFASHRGRRVSQQGAASSLLQTRQET